MLGSAAFRTGVAPGGALAPGWVKNELWRKARTVPSLDLRFADDKSLVDATTGASLVTFTRASSGTYVGSDGVLRSAVTNLLLRSEEFETTWTATRASVSSNLIASPSGTTTADKLIEDTTATNTHFVQQSVSVTTGTAYTFSLFVKASERNFVQLVFNGQFATVVSAIFDLSTGAVGTTTGTPVTSAVSLSYGWWRLSITATANATGSTLAQVRVSNSSITATYTGDGTSGIYLWGAQLEQASTVGEYIPTTSTINSAPRFDHNPTTGESLGLLVEEARTNLCLQSEDFSTTWTKVAATVTTDAIVSPTGVLNADKLVETTANSSHYAVQSVSVTTTSRTASIYFKAGERTQARIEHSGNTGGAARRITINLSTGAITGAATIGTGGLNSFSESIASVGNGWYRVTSTIDPTVTLGNTQSLVVQILDNTGSATYVGDGTSGIYLWGAQLEAGAFPTSYIATTTAAATRSADVASITGTAFTSWYLQDEGTVFAECSALLNTAQGICSFRDSASATTNTRLRKNTANVYAGVLRDGGVAKDITVTPLPSLIAGQNIKMALAFKTNNCAFTGGGQNPGTQNTFTLASMNTFDINGSVALGESAANTTIRRITYFPTRLPDNTLQSITQ